MPGQHVGPGTLARGPWADGAQKERFYMSEADESLGAGLPLKRLTSGRFQDSRRPQPTAWPARLRRDDAVAEVISSVLIVAMTVLMTAGLVTLLLASKPGPADPLHADFTVQAQKGADGWGTGDEHLAIKHVGGERLTLSNTILLVTIGDETTRYEAGGSNPLDHAAESAFDDSGSDPDTTWTIGETWRTPDASIPVGTKIQANVVDTSEQTEIIWAASASAGSAACGIDLQPPRVTAWQQTPADVSTTTTGDVHVRATIRDACNAVDATSPPDLEHRINDGSDPSYSSIQMTQGGGDHWHANITGVTWVDHATETLEYRVTGTTDSEGNTGDSGVQSDLIQIVGTQTPVSAFTVNEGTQSGSLSDAQADDDVEVTFTEETQDIQRSNVLDANDWDDGSDTWSNEANAFENDDTYATTTATNPIDYHLEDPPTMTTVTDVVLKANVKIDTGKPPNDAFTLQACFPNDQCGDASPTMGSSATETEITWDVSAAGSRHPMGNGSWSASDVEALELRISPVAQGAADGTWSVDYARAVATGQTQFESLEVEAEFSGVPNGALHQLELEYSIADETFDVQVWDWNASAWKTRGQTLIQGQPTEWTYRLTDDEYDPNNSQVLIRFIDTSDGSTKGSLSLDYLWVVTS